MGGAVTAAGGAATGGAAGFLWSGDAGDVVIEKEVVLFGESQAAGSGVGGRHRLWLHTGELAFKRQRDDKSYDQSHHD